ncbi:MAG TPA: hypothetical protein VGO61_10920 [Steroidobacteraceae bacterium]|nr:hypothetical protein [Steroidobacteraceae bacterium]
MKSKPDGDCGAPTGWVSVVASPLDSSSGPLLLGTYRGPTHSPLEYGFSEYASGRFGAMLVCLDVNKAEAPIARHE